MTGDIPHSEHPDCGNAERALHAADDEAFEADMNAALALVNVPPTTMAGVLALIDYVDNFNRGKFYKFNDCIQQCRRALAGSIGMMST